MKWQLISNQAISLRCWDDEFVVYNRLSGDTHLLGSAAGHILAKLQHAPMDTTSLGEALCHIWQVDPSEELAVQVNDILADLQKLELIEEAA
jgi:PqqD family protein of HPr-rel-A system